MVKNKPTKVAQKPLSKGVKRADLGEKILSSDVSDGNQIVQMIYDAAPVASYDGCK